MDKREQQRKEFINKVYELEQEYGVEIVCDYQYYYDVEKDEYFFEGETEVLSD